MNSPGTNFYKKTVLIDNVTTLIPVFECSRINFCPPNNNYVYRQIEIPWKHSINTRSLHKSFIVSRNCNFVSKFYLVNVQASENMTYQTSICEVLQTSLFIPGIGIVSSLCDHKACYFIRTSNLFRHFSFALLCVHSNFRLKDIDSEKIRAITLFRLLFDF